MRIARVLVLACLVAPAMAGLPVQTGEHVYRNGSGERPLRVLVDGTPMQASAATIACANCHGIDARGGWEGQAPALAGQALTRRRHDGQARPGYDLQAFTRALREGTASNGRALDATMPRYDIGDTDVQALYAYLAALDESSAGVSVDTILLWQLVPAEGERPAIAVRAAEMTGTWQAAVNAGGGLYGRQVIVESVEVRRGRDRNAALAARVLAEPPFAIVVNHARGDDPSLDAALCAAGIPDLYPVALQGSEPGPCLRPLQSTLAGQAHQLVSLAMAREQRPRRAFVLSADDAASVEAADVAVSALRALPGAPVEVFLLPVGRPEGDAPWPADWSQHDVVFHFGGVDALQQLFDTLPAGIEVFASVEQVGLRTRYPPAARLTLFNPWDDVERRWRPALEAADWYRRGSDVDDLSAYSLVALESTLREAGRRLTRQGVVEARR